MHRAQIHGYPMLLTSIQLSGMLINQQTIENIALDIEIEEVRNQ